MADKKSAGIAAVLSFLIPGLGQIYNGEFVKGALFIILAVIFFLLSFFLIGIPLYLGLWIFGIYDAYKGAERFNQSHQTRQCMKCGAQIPMTAAVCPHCGNPIPGASPYGYAAPGQYPAPTAQYPAAPVMPPAAPPPLKQSGQMFCPTCGKWYPASQGRFCPQDATELKQAT